jgi:hypothetical protein
MAFLAEETRAIRGHSDGLLAERTGEDFQESGIQRHGHLLTHAPGPVNETEPGKGRPSLRPESSLGIMPDAPRGSNVFAQFEKG